MEPNKRTGSSDTGVQQVGLLAVTLENVLGEVALALQKKREDNLGIQEVNMPCLAGRKEEKVRDEEWTGETCLCKKRLQDYLFSNVSSRDVCCHLCREKIATKMIARLLFSLLPAWKDATHEQGVSLTLEPNTTRASRLRSRYPDRVQGNEKLPYFTQSCAPHYPVPTPQLFVFWRIFTSVGSTGGLVH